MTTFRLLYFISNIFQSIFVLEIRSNYIITNELANIPNKPLSTLTRVVVVTACGPPTQRHAAINTSAQHRSLEDDQTITEDTRS